MKHLSNFNKYNWSKDNLITEDTEFFQYQFSQNTPNPLGPTHGFATNPDLSIYTGQDSPYTDHYSRTQGLINDLKGLIDHFYKNSQSIAMQKFDYFTEDIEYYDNLKILRMFENEAGYLDIYISFEFNEQEYFGAFRNFNKPYVKPKFECELFTHNEYSYMNEEYQLKLKNFLRKLLNNWFIPKEGLYKNLKEECMLKDETGNKIPLKKDKTVNVKGYNVDENNMPYLIIEWKNNEYYLGGNDFYWFNWRFENIE